MVWHRQHFDAPYGTCPGFPEAASDRAMQAKLGGDRCTDNIHRGQQYIGISTRSALMSYHVE
jgi:hypothetical protein